MLKKYAEIITWRAQAQQGSPNPSNPNEGQLSWWPTSGPNNSEPQRSHVFKLMLNPGLVSLISPLHEVQKQFYRSLVDVTEICIC